jgi:predicted transcriptional regulator
MAGMATSDSTVLSGKDQVRKILEELPDDSSFEEILREMAFERMIERGLADADAGRVIGNDEMKRRIDEWAR